VTIDRYPLSHPRRIIQEKCGPGGRRLHPAARKLYFDFGKKIWKKEGTVG
jgi:hypothetical protein